MLLLAVVGGLLLCLALAVREYQQSRERAVLLQALEQLRAAHELQRQQHKRLAEDQWVLQRLLVERGLLEQAAVDRGRLRLIDLPRRQAAEREAVLRNFKVAAIDLASDDDSKVH